MASGLNLLFRGILYQVISGIDFFFGHIPFLKFGSDNVILPKKKTIGYMHCKRTIRDNINATGDECWYYDKVCSVDFDGCSWCSHECDGLGIPRSKSDNCRIDISKLEDPSHLFPSEKVKQTDSAGIISLMIEYMNNVMLAMYLFQGDRNGKKTFCAECAEDITEYEQLELLMCKELVGESEQDICSHRWCEKPAKYVCLNNPDGLLKEARRAFDICHSICDPWFFKEYEKFPEFVDGDEVKRRSIHREADKMFNRYQRSKGAFQGCLDAYKSLAFSCLFTRSSGCAEDEMAPIIHCEETTGVKRSNPYPDRKDKTVRDHTRDLLKRYVRIDPAAFKSTVGEIIYHCYESGQKILDGVDPIKLINTNNEYDDTTASESGDESGSDEDTHSSESGAYSEGGEWDDEDDDDHRNEQYRSWFQSEHLNRVSCPIDVNNFRVEELDSEGEVNQEYDDPEPFDQSTQSWARVPEVSVIGENPNQDAFQARMREEHTSIASALLMSYQAGISVTEADNRLNSEEGVVDNRAVEELEEEERYFHTPE